MRVPWPLVRTWTVIPEAALTPAERFGVNVALYACRLVMCPDDCPIHVVGLPIAWSGTIRLLLDSGTEARPAARLPPTIPTAGDGAPRTISSRHITPGHSGAQEPEDAMQDTAMVGRWTALLGGQEGL
jgi:hypothetical protein